MYAQYYIFTTLHSINNILQQPFFHFRSVEEEAVNLLNTRDQMADKKHGAGNYPRPGGGSSSTDDKQTTRVACKHTKILYRGIGDVETMCRIATKIHEQIQNHQCENEQWPTISIICGRVPDINIAKYMARKQREEEKEKKEKEKQKELDMKHKFEQMKRNFRRRGVNIILTLGTKHKSVKNLWK